MKNLTLLLLSLALGIGSLEASQVARRAILQMTKEAPQVTTPQKSRCVRLLTWCGSFLWSAEQAKVMAETKQQKARHETLFQTLFDLTTLPADLIAIIASYNQATFFVGNGTGSLTSLAVVGSEVVAVGLSDGTIVLVNVAEGKILGTLRGHKGSVNALNYLGAGQLASLSTIGTYVPHDMEILPCATTGSLQLRACASERQTSVQDETLRVWQLGNLFSERDPLIQAIEPEPTCSDDKVRRAAVEEIAQLRKTGLKVRAADAYLDRTWVISGSAPLTQEKDQISHWVVDELEFTLPAGHATSQPLPFAKQDFIGWSTGEILMMDGVTKKVDRLSGHARAVRILRMFTTKTGRNCLASGSDDGTIRIWDLATKKCLQTLVGHTGPIRDVKPSIFPEDYSKGEFLVSISDDATMRKWSIVEEETKTQ